MSYAVPADMMVIFDVDASVTENRDLGTAKPLVDELLVSITGPSSPAEQMQGGLVFTLWRTSL